MIYYHYEKECPLDLSSDIKAHSGDQTVAYKTANGEELYLSYYFPPNHQTCNKAFPAILFIHGGGWVSHKIFDNQNNNWQGDHLGFLARHFAQKGYVSVSVDYRLSRDVGQKDGYQIIDCVDDCADAVRYILQYADNYKIDTQCVYLLGESAGGHLAGMLATRLQFANFRFKTTFLFNSILDFESDTNWQTRVPQESKHPLLKDMTPDVRRTYLSPVTGIHPDISPVILFHGDRDTTVDLQHSERFYKRMQELGLPCELYIMENAQHAFLLAEYTQQQDICKNAVSILETYL